MKTLIQLTNEIKTVENDMHIFEAEHADYFTGQFRFSMKYANLERKRNKLTSEYDMVMKAAKESGVSKINDTAKYMYLRTVKQELGILDVFVEIDTDKIYFVAKDVAVQMGYKKPTKAITDNCMNPILVTANDIQLMPQLLDNQGALAEGTLVNQALTDSDYQTMFMNGKNPFNPAVRQLTLIPESDLYALILRSKLPAARQFTAWVCNDVLPSIRKTGSYVMNEKCKIFDTLIDAKGFVTTKAFAKTVGYGPNKLLASLRAAKILMKNGNRRNLPYQKYINSGYFIVKDVITSNGFATTLAYITPKGQVWLTKKLMQIEEAIKEREERQRLIKVATESNSWYNDNFML